MHAKKNQEMTLAEFNCLKQDDQMTYELLDGVFLMSPRPKMSHQRIQSHLHGKLYAFLADKPCDIITETEIEFRNSVVVPDLFLYCDAISEDDIQRYKGVPKLIIEILSPSTAFYDTTRKMQIYEQMGVTEYWIVSPTVQTLTIHNFELEVSKVLGKSDQIESDVLKELCFAVEEIFV